VAEGKEDARIIRTAREINNRKPLWVVDKVLHSIEEFRKLHKHEPKVAVMGIAFKPDIDDLRESPSLFIAKQLMDKGIELMIAEPNIKNYIKIQLTDYQEAVRNADIVLFLVAHKEFKNMKIPEGKIIIDICGITNKFI
jgi:UDP-N-acetyl-D-mannosaminuronic acid dehydrogenase